MKIGVDFDDVVVDTVTAWCALANEHHGGDRWEPKSFTEWDLSKQTGISPNTVHQMFLDIVYTECSIVPAALLGIEELVVDHDVVILTDNPRYDEMRHWLDLHGLREVPLEAELSDKAMYAAVNEFDVIIDDKPDTLKRASDYGVHAIRFLRPWNANMEGWGADRCEHTAHTWGEILAGVRLVRYASKPGDFIPCDPLYLMDFFGEPFIRDNPSYRQSDVPKQWQLIEDSNLIGYELDEPIVTNTTPFVEAQLAADRFAKTVEEIVVNEHGAKQTDLGARFDLLPALALKKVAGVLEQGAKKYGQGNWRGLSVEECHNHTLGHAIAFNRTNDIEDLAHAACRALMTLELALVEEKRTIQPDDPGWES